MAYTLGHLRRIAVGLCLVLPWLTGCAAFHPIKGVPVRYLSDDLKVGRRNEMRTIDLSLLKQPWDRIHRVDSGDVLGIYIAGVLGKVDENPQVQIPQNSDYQPAAGVPVTVREDGTVSLPWIGALNVRGKTIRETEEIIRSAYTDHSISHEFLNADKQRILVSLQRPRQTQVLVVRQDSRNEPLANAAVGLLNIGTAKRGTGKVVSLPAYRNDVLHALIATDGLPGLDAENAVYIIRRQTSDLDLDPHSSPDIDPATLIRQSKAVETPVFRSQNQDFRNDSNFQPMGPGLDTSGRWARGDQSFNSYAPTPLYGTVQQSQSPTPLSPTPLPANQPQTRFPNANGLPRMPPSPYGMPPNGASPFSAVNNIPGQGYSLPESPYSGMGQSSAGSPHTDFPNDDNTNASNDTGSSQGRRIIRIPIRLGPDEHVDIKKEDIILNDGDIVFIESRDSEVFFTGGLLGGGQYTLPRDKDLNILEALSIATSRVGGNAAARQIGGVSALNGDVTISPSNVVVIRRLPEGGEIPIKIDLYRASGDPSERIYIQPGDYIYLQYTPLEAIGAFIERHLLEGALFGVFTQNAKL